MNDHIPATIDLYFAKYGHYHAEKAKEVLRPLHLDGVDPLPPFEGITRQPFEPQAHAIAACVKMSDVHRGLLVGECGTGKTIMGQLVVHEHAVRSRRKGGKGGNYRAIVLCPDHLISKWKDEIESTIPGAKVTTFDVASKGRAHLLKETIELYTGMATRTGHWPKPQGAEWFILGREQSKLKSYERGMKAEKHHSYDVVRRHRKLTQFRCPICGTQVVDNNGAEVDTSKKTLKCAGKFVRSIPDPDTRQQGRDRRMLAGDDAEAPVGRTRKDPEGNRYLVCACNEPLWQYTNKPYRWAPAKFINKKLRRAFSYLIVDEVHEQAKQTTAQANAMGCLASGIPHVLALTGTLIGGSAKDLFYLMFRLNARPFLEDGFGWSSVMDFTKKYGRIERTVTTRTKQGDGGGSYRGGRRSSMRSEPTESKSERAVPGIMPALFGAHLIDKSVFMSLEDMSDKLPEMREYVGGPPGADYNDDDNAYWQECKVPMEGAHAIEYKRVEEKLVSECKRLVQEGNMSLLGTMLTTCLAYPDYPWGWGRLGYYEKEEDGSQAGFTHVVTPDNQPTDIIYPKEQALLDIIAREVEAGNQVWVYCVFTKTHDVQARLETLVKDAGYRVKSLRQKTVPLKQRLAWLSKNGSKADVIISHPELVKTGVDFFAKDRSFNFSTIVFFETGYSVYTLRQAAARAWRLLQWKKCRVYYLHYAETMQARAMGLIARKMAAASQLDGDLNMEGLTALGDSGDVGMALARSISSGIKDTDISRNWAKIGHTIKPKGLDSFDLSDDDMAALEDFDDLPAPLALAACTVHAHFPEIGRDKLYAIMDDFDLSEADMEALASF